MNYEINSLVFKYLYYCKTSFNYLILRVNLKIPSIDSIEGISMLISSNNFTELSTIWRKILGLNFSEVYHHILLFSTKIKPLRGRICVELYLGEV